MRKLITPFNIGEIVGSLTILSEPFKKILPCGKKHFHYKVKCKCGKIFETLKCSLHKGDKNLKSCGCLKLENSLPVGAICGYLTIISNLFHKDTKKGKKLFYKVKCKCGVEKELQKKIVESGHTKSCGCLFKDVMEEIFVTHGHTKNKKPSHIYQSWNHMLSRCNNVNNKRYHRYGGRGIKVEFKDFIEFKDWSFANGYKEGLTIDRINNNGNYSSNNCRWISFAEQARNKSTNKIFSLNGEEKIATDWAKDKKCAVSYHTLLQRMKKGWDFEKALTTPATRPGRWGKK